MDLTRSRSLPRTPGPARRRRPADRAAARDRAVARDRADRYASRRLAVPDARVPGAAGRALYTALVAVVAAVLRCLARLAVTGPDLPRGGVVVVGNHRSVVDGPLLAVVGRRRGRQLRMLGTAGVFTAPVLGPVLLAVGMVPVKRRTAEAGGALRGASALLRAGEAVALFPEGRIHDAQDGLPAPLRSGAARLALATGAPVVAVGLTGSEHVVRPGTWVPRRGRTPVTAAVSAPLDLLAALGLPGPVADPDPATVAAATAVLADLLTAQVARRDPVPA